MKAIALIFRTFASIIVGTGIIASLSIFISDVINITTGNTVSFYKAGFSLLALFILCLLGATLIRRTTILIVISTLLNTLFVFALASVAFGPADGPEGPEAAGRGIAAFFLMLFLIEAAGIILCIERSKRHKSSLCAQPLYGRGSQEKIIPP
jgi:hypothetical protein